MGVRHGFETDTGILIFRGIPNLDWRFLAAGLENYSKSVGCCTGFGTYCTCILYTCRQYIFQLRIEACAVHQQHRLRLQALPLMHRWVQNCASWRLVCLPWNLFSPELTSRSLREEENV